jgi:septin family protein
MICDNGLADKLNNFEVLKHLNQHSTTLLVGKPRSGKTSLITSLFSSRECMKKVFHKVYIFQPASSGASVKNNVFDKLARANLHELTIEDLNQVYNDIQALLKIIINVLF